MGEIIILTECGPSIGHGHLSRCESLRKAFKEQGANPRVWVAAHPATGRIPEGMEKVDWYAVGKYRDELQKASFVLVDSFLVDAVQLDKLHSIQPRTAVIDDYHRRDHRKGVVIDPTIGSESWAYPERYPNVLYLLGCRFCPLQSVFSSAGIRSHAGPIKSVLVTFGGTDIRQLTLPVLLALQKGYPALEKQVVIGSGFPDVPMLENLKDEHTHIHRQCDAEAMHSVMATSDIAICGGGQTLYEMASQGLPAIAVCLIDNQLDDIEGFFNIRFVQKAGWWDDPSLISNVVAGVDRLMTGERRQACATSGQGHLDGRGASRLAAAMSEHFALQPPVFLTWP
jgi:spore coat polysaccharide biosynthesis predicted glycosyltransferase SpsG